VSKSLAEQFRENAERCDRHAAECDAEEKATLEDSPASFLELMGWTQRLHRIRRNAHDARTMARVWRESERLALAQTSEPTADQAKFV